MLENTSDIEKEVIKLYNENIPYTAIADRINKVFGLNDDIGYNKNGIGYIITKTRRQNPESITRAKNEQNAKNASSDGNAKLKEARNKQISYPIKDSNSEIEHSIASKFSKTTLKDNSQKVNGVLENLTEQQAKDESSILTAFGYDPKKWKIRSNKANSYQMQGKGGTVKTFWQYNITVQPIANALSVDDMTKMFNEVEPIKINPINQFINEDSDRNLVLSFADLHFGITTFEEVKPLLDDLLEILKLKKYKKIRIEQLGDLFHSDMFTSIQTGHGTLLSTDGTQVQMEKAVQDALKFYKTIINASLQNTSDVEIFHTQGNHSPSLEYMFLVAMEERYPDLKIHKNIQYRTAYKIDNVGILIAHGDTAKNKLPMLFANEFCDIWGSTTYREIHTGHYHFETVKDDSGVVQRQMGTPKPSDGYEKKNGFTMAHKKLQAFEYGKNDLKVIYNLGI